MLKKSLFVLFLTAFGGLHAQQTFSLEQAIDYALKNNLELKTKDVAERDAVSQIREFKAIGLPKLNSFINYQYFFAVPAQPLQDFISPTIYNVLFDENVIPRRELGPPASFKFTLFQPHQLVAGAELSSMVFDGSYLYGVKAAKLYKELVAAEKAVTERDIRQKITQAYLGVLIAQENLSILEKNKSNVAASLKEVRAMYQNGFAEQLDVDRLTLSADNIDIEIKRMKQLTEVSKNALKFQMNFPLLQPISLSDNLTDLTNIPLETSLINESEYVGQRPEMQVISKGLELNNIDLSRIKAGYLPTVRAFVNGQASLFRRNLFSNQETGFIPQSAVGLAINVPIYDGGDKSAKIQRTRLNIEKANLEKETFEKATLMEIRNSSSALANAREVVTARQNALKISQGIYEKTLIKFREGVGSSVEVIQAEASLYQAQSVYINAVYDLLTAYTDFQKAIGKI
ncbi:MAG: TolC family protein [Saprospiraceae bacterium]|nr:TolC family protein [Saprospiraceae bacterium]